MSNEGDRRLSNRRATRWFPGAATVTALTIIAAIALAACGGGGGSTSSGSTESQGGSSAGLKEVENELAALYKGTYKPPPSSGPKPEPGKKIWLLSCGQALSTCSRVISGAEEAAKKVGWDPTVFDTKSDPNLASSAVRQAIAAHADGIFIMAVDCDLFEKPLEEAKEAGIKVMAAESYDCSENHPGQPTLFDGQVTYPEGPYSEFIYNVGAAQAVWVIAKTEAKGEVINFADNEIEAVARYQEGFADQMGTCSECKVDEVPFKFADIGTTLQQKAEQALLKFPNAGAVQVPTEAAITVGGVEAAVQSAGRSGDMFITGYEGVAQTMTIVRESEGTKGGVGVALEWEGFAGIDGLNRLFHGEKPKSSGVGIQLFDSENNPGTSGTWTPPIDYAPIYEKSWGVG